MAALDFDGFSLTLPGPLNTRSTRTGPGEHEVTVEIGGPLEPDAPRSQLEAAGFEIVNVHGSVAGFSLVAVRDGTTAYMTFSGLPYALVYVSVSNPAAHADLPVVEGCFTWGDVRWPAYFLDGKLASAPSDDAVFITARVPPHEDLVERYRAWALRSGFEVEDPINAWEEEPDLGITRGMRFRDRCYLARLELEDADVLLYITRRPGT